EAVERLMLDYLLPNASRFYGETFGRGDAGEHAAWIAGYILARRLSTITAREIGRAYRPLRDDRQAIGAAMEALRMAGWVMRADAGRQNSEKWSVVAKVHEVFAARAEHERARRAAEREAIKAAAEKVRA